MQVRLLFLATAALLLARHHGCYGAGAVIVANAVYLSAAAASWSFLLSCLCVVARVVANGHPSRHASNYCGVTPYSPSLYLCLHLLEV